MTVFSSTKDMNTPHSQTKPEEQPEKTSLENSLLIDSFAKVQWVKDFLVKENKTISPQMKIKDIALSAKKYIMNLFEKEDIKNFLNSKHIKNNPKITDNVSIKGLVDALYSQMDEYSIQLQKKTQQKYIAEGKVTPWPQRLFENKRKELVASRSFFHLVQLAFSPEDWYLSSTSLSPKDPHYRDAVVICPSKIKDIYKQMWLIHLGADCAVFKSFLAKFIPLSYIFQWEERITNRIGTINDKALCFGVATIPFKEEEPLTPGERKKREYVPFAEVFDDVYDLQRNQKHILTNFDKKLTDHEEVNQEVKKLFDEEIDWLRAVYVDTKDGAKRRKLEELFEQFQNETSFYTRTALLFQFRKIAGQNVGKDNQHLLAWLRTLGKRGEEIASMFSLISAQLDTIEEYISQDKVVDELFSSLYSSLYMYPDILRISYKDINDALSRYLVEAKPAHTKSFAMDPYSTFFDQIALIAGPLKYIKHGRGEQELERPIADKSRLISLQFIFLSMFAQYNAYKLENDLKTGKLHFSDIHPGYLKDKLHKEEIHTFIDSYNIGKEYSIHGLLDSIIEATFCTSEKKLYESLEKIQKHEVA